MEELDMVVLIVAAVRSPDAVCATGLK